MQEQTSTNMQANTKNGVLTRSPSFTLPKIENVDPQLSKSFTLLSGLETTEDSEISDPNSKIEALAEWCRLSVASVAKDIDITGFDMENWGSGLALCALIYARRPDAIVPLIASTSNGFDAAQRITFDSLLANSRITNLRLAFTAAHRLGVPDGILDTEEMANDENPPDMFKIITYLIQLYHYLTVEESVKLSGQVSNVTSTSSPNSLFHNPNIRMRSTSSPLASEVRKDAKKEWMSRLKNLQDRRTQQKETYEKAMLGGSSPILPSVQVIEPVNIVRPTSGSAEKRKTPPVPTVPISTQPEPMAPLMEVQAVTPAEELAKHVGTPPVNSNDTQSTNSLFTRASERVMKHASVQQLQREEILRAHQEMRQEAEQQSASIQPATQPRSALQPQTQSPQLTARAQFQPQSSVSPQQSSGEYFNNPFSQPPASSSQPSVSPQPSSGDYLNNPFHPQPTSQPSVQPHPSVKSQPQSSAPPQQPSSGLYFNNPFAPQPSVQPQTSVKPQSQPSVPPQQPSGEYFNNPFAPQPSVQPQISVKPPSQPSVAPQQPSSGQYSNNPFVLQSQATPQPSVKSQPQSPQLTARAQFQPQASVPPQQSSGEYFNNPFHPQPPSVASQSHPTISPLQSSPQIQSQYFSNPLQAQAYSPPIRQPQVPQSTSTDKKPEPERQIESLRGRKEAARLELERKKLEDQRRKELEKGQQSRQIEQQDKERKRMEELQNQMEQQYQILRAQELRSQEEKSQEEELAAKLADFDDSSAAPILVSSDEIKDDYAQFKSVSDSFPDRLKQAMNVTVVSQTPAPTRVASIKPNYLYYLARALVDFHSNEDNQLHFNKNDIIEIYERDASGWWLGRLEGKCGWVPSDYFVLLEEHFFDETNSPPLSPQPGRLTPPSAPQSSGPYFIVPTQNQVSVTSSPSLPSSPNLTASSSPNLTAPSTPNNNNSREIRSKRSQVELDRLFQQIDNDEKKLEEQQVIVDDNAEPTMEGWLHKLDTTGLVKKWRKRFFSLRGSRLLYYKDKPSPGDPPTGFIAILFANTIEPVSDKKDGKKTKTTFEIITPQKIYYLQADSTDSMIDWICSLKEAKSSYSAGVTIESPLRVDVSPIIDQSKSGMLEVMMPNGKFKKRWFTLKDGVLTEFEARNGAALDKIPLYGCSFEELKKGERKAKGCFGVVTGSKMVVLKADSEPEMLDWLSILKLQKACIQNTLESINKT